MILNIFNGDCAYNAWRKIDCESAALVWRENYLEGRIPAPDTPPDEFARIRASELHALMPELDERKILASLLSMNTALAKLSAEDSVILWFDACMYDQTMLARILFLLNNTQAAVFLICEDIGERPEDIAKQRNSARRLTSDDISLYASAWKAIAGGFEVLKQFTAGNRFPFLTKALARYLEERPDANGLSKSEHRLIEIVNSGKRVPREIFQEFNAREEYPFMGDTTCYRLLEKLAKDGHIAEHKKTYHPC